MNLKEALIELSEQCIVCFNNKCSCKPTAKEKK